MRLPLIFLLLISSLGRILFAQEAILVSTTPATLNAQGTVSYESPVLPIDSVWIAENAAYVYGDSSQNLSFPLAAGSYNTLVYTDSVRTSIALNIALINPESTVSSTESTCGRNATVWGTANKDVAAVRLYNDNSQQLASTTPNSAHYWDFAVYPGTYYVVVLDMYGNYRTYSTTVRRISNPGQLVVGQPSSYCGTATGTARGSTTYPLLSLETTGAYQLHGNTNFSIDSLATGTHQLVLHMLNECRDTISFEIDRHQPPQFRVDVQGISCNYAQDGNMNIQVESPLDFQLYYQDNPVAYPDGFPLQNLSPGSDSVRYDDIHGCSQYISFAIDSTFDDCFINPPNAMHPDESWSLRTPDGYEISQLFPEYKISIVDTNGKIVSETLPWNGRYPDNRAVDGVVFWSMESPYNYSGYIHVFATD